MSGSLKLPALRGLGTLADHEPVICIDTREQDPLVFSRLQSVRGTLTTGDYSIAGLESLFAVEQKSISDLVGCCMGAQRVGKVFPASPKTLQRKKIALCADNQDRGWKAITWINDGLRHTFCSAYLTQHESVDRLLLQTGHSDPGILWRHYYRSMTKADGAAFWAIVPKI